MFLAKTSSDAKFNVNIHSDYLVLERYEHDPNTDDKVFYISPKYNMAEWQEFGEVVLGEINISLEGNNHPEAKDQRYGCTICVVQQSPRSEIVTVINPQSSTVKIEPHQILEVVCFETSWNKFKAGQIEVPGLRDEWDHVENDLANNEFDLKLKRIHYEIAGDTLRNGKFPVKSRFGLKINQKLDPMIQEVVEAEMCEQNPPAREHHWWFSCDEASQKKVLDLANGVYPVCTLDFEGVCSEFSGELDYSALRTTNIQLAVRGKNKSKMHPFYLNPDSVEHKMEVVKRTSDKFNQILTNPLAVEQIDFEPGYESLVIEVVQPNCLWNDLPEDTQWDFVFDTKPICPRFVKMTQLESRHQWGKKYQRIRINHNFVPDKNALESKFLGAIFIFCKGKEEDHDGRKRISFWLTPNARKDSTYRTGPSTPLPLLSEKKKKSNISSPTSSSSLHYNSDYEYDYMYGGGYSTNPNGTKKKEREYKGPRVSGVKFEEIASTPTLEGDEKVKKLSDVWIGSKNYHNSCCTDFTKVKKKETSSTSGCRTFSSTNESRQKKSEGYKEKAKNGSEKEASGKTFANAGTKPTAFVVYNPSHTGKITVQNGQPLIIRMSEPSKNFHNKCKAEQWAISYNGNFEVDHCKTTVLDTGTVYQEIKLEVINVPPIVGLHPAGCVKFTCSEGTVAAFIEVKVDNIDECIYDPAIPNMKIVPPSKLLGSEQSRKLYISEWAHNDAVVIDPELSLYVRSPASISNWSSEEWQMEIEQYPLPKEVWNQGCLEDVIDNIDTGNPWFVSSCPLQMSHTYLFRPLVIQQPHAIDILKAAARVLPEDILTIGRITFRNNCHPNNSKLALSVGVIETTYSIEKSFGICVDISKYHEKVISPEMVVEDISAKEEIVLKEGVKKLVIKMTPLAIEIERGGMIKSPWFMGPWPKCLDHNSIYEKDGKHVFVYDVIGGDGGKLKLICGNKQVDILVKCEEKQCA
jgi:hypothetical protein